MKNNQLALFDRGQIEEKEVTGLTCATCVHIQKWDEDGRIMRYCGKLKDKGSPNGLKVVELRSSACQFHTLRMI